MREAKLWSSGEGLDKAASLAAIAAKKFWRKDVAKACVELYGHNFDRGYAYHAFLCLDTPGRVKASVRKVIRYGPGDIKRINLHLYKRDEKSECEELEGAGDLSTLKASLRGNDERAKELATEIAREHIGSSMDPRKEVVPEYEPIIKCLMRGNGDTSVIWIMGFNFQADMIIRNARRDFKWLGKAVGYGVEDVKKATPVEVEEEGDSYFVELSIH